MKNSSDYYSEYRKLKDSIIKDIRKAVGRKKFKFEDSFEDEAHNELHAVSAKGVFFDGIVGESYPLGELGINDALYILSLIE